MRQRCVIGTLAEFERDVIRARTQAGLAAARARGRPKKLDSATKVAMARSLSNDKTNTVTNICTTMGISRATLYRSLDTPAPPGDAGSGALNKGDVHRDR